MVLGEDYAAIATFDGQPKAKPYRTRLMTLKTQVEGPLCVVFDVLAWDNFTVTRVTPDGQEQTLLTRQPEDVERPLWQRFMLAVRPSSNNSQVIFHSYHTPGFRPYTAALDNVSIYNMSCQKVTTGKDAL